MLLVYRDLKVFKEYKVNKGSLVYQDLQVKTALMALMDKMVRMVQTV